MKTRSNRQYHFVSILSAAALISCEQKQTISAGVEVEVIPPTLEREGAFNATADELYAWPIHVSLTVSGPSDFKHSLEVGSGSERLKLPTGTNNIRASYFAYVSSDQLNSSSAMCKDGQMKLVAAQAQAVESISAESKKVTLKFGSFKEIETEEIGFSLENISASEIQFLDPISLKPVIDPCTGRPHSKSLDGKDRLVFDVPHYGFSQSSHVRLVTKEGHKDFVIPFPTETKKNVFVTLAMKGEKPVAVESAPTADFDNDGISNSQELAAGSNPFRDKVEVKLVQAQTLNGQTQFVLSVNEDWKELKCRISNVDEVFQPCSTNFSRNLAAGKYVLAVLVRDYKGYESSTPQMLDFEVMASNTNVVTQQVTLTGTSASGNQVFTNNTVQCSANLGPLESGNFQFYNEKSSLPRHQITLGNGVTTASYILKAKTGLVTLAASDVAGDKIYCKVKISRGGNVVRELTSNRVTISASAPTLTATGNLNQEAMWNHNTQSAPISMVSLAASGFDGNAVTLEVDKQTCGASVNVDVSAGRISGSATQVEAGTNVCNVVVKAKSNGIYSAPVVLKMNVICDVTISDTEFTWPSGLSCPVSTVRNVTISETSSLTSLTVPQNSEFKISGHLIVDDGTEFIVSTTNEMKANKVTVNGIITAKGKGFGAEVGPSAQSSGKSCTAAQCNGGGGGLGGDGGKSSSSGIGKGLSFSAATIEPFQPRGRGAGGGNGFDADVIFPGGAGGGVIWFTVFDELYLKGSGVNISADGNNGASNLNYGGGGGSGGSVYIRASKISGNGQISARGGDGGTPDAGAGGGGRIAVYCSNCDFTTLANRITANAGTGYSGGGAFQGSVGLFDSSQTPPKLYVGSRFAIEKEGEIPAGTVGDIDVLQNAEMSLYGGVTLNAQDISTSSYSKIYFKSKNIESNSGGTWAVLRGRNMTVASNSEIFANGMGYRSGRGPGSGMDGSTNQSGGGGGNGGNGGRSDAGTSSGGAAVASNISTEKLGSGGGECDGTPSCPGGSGGGAIVLNLTGTLTNNGTISANGEGSVYYNSSYSGGGAGGTIELTAKIFSGTGTIQAKGGNAYGNAGAGGGGKIKLQCTELQCTAPSYYLYSTAGSANLGGASNGADGILEQNY